MAGLILTLSVIFIIVGGFLTRRFVVRMNRLENRVNVIVHELSKTEQPLIGSVSDIRLNTNRAKIPVTIKGGTYFVYDDSTIEEFVREVGNPDKTYGDPHVYTLIYLSSFTTDHVKVNFVDNVLTEIEHIF